MSWVAQWEEAGEYSEDGGEKPAADNDDGIDELIDRTRKNNESIDIEIAAFNKSYNGAIGPYWTKLDMDNHQLVSQKFRGY